MSQISILIVTYNTGSLIRRCLQNLPDDVEVIVFDNASTDDTPQIIRDEFPTVKLTCSSENLGFGAGNNRGFAASSGDFIILVNPDLVITGEAIHGMVDYLVAHPEAGIIAPRTVNEAGKLLLTAHPPYHVGRIAAKYWALDRLFPSLVYGDFALKIQQADFPLEAAWLQGACLGMQREVYEKLGGFDDRFFLFVEDVDLCARARVAGWRVVYLPHISVIHTDSATVSRFPLVRVRNYHTSPIYYFRKRNQPLTVWLLKLIFALELVLKILIRSLRRYKTEQIRAEWQVLKELWRY